MKHKWWHGFFTKTWKTPQMIPANMSDTGDVKFEWNRQFYCRLCKKRWEKNALDKYRK
jgi:hypothetical protein